MPAATLPGIRRFVLAVRFLTRIPLPGPCAGGEELGKSAAYFPGVGLLVGGVVAAAAIAADRVWGNALFGGAAAVIANALVTGGLHLDGLMDTCDGIFGSHTRERALEIMRDPRVGSFGVLGGMAAVLVRFALCAGPEGPPWQAILVAPVAGRCAQVWAMGLFPYARAQGIGSAFRQSLGKAQVATATLSAAGICFLTGGVPGLVWLAGGWALSMAVARRLARRLGGLTGDSYGAVTEVGEWAVLAAAGLLPGALSPVVSAWHGCFR